MLADLTLASAGTDTSVYTCPSGKTRTAFSVNISNLSASAVTVRVALVAASSTPNVDGRNYIEYETSIAVGQSLERAGLLLLSNQILFVRASAANAVSVVVYGIEE